MNRFVIVKTYGRRAEVCADGYHSDRGFFHFWLRNDGGFSTTPVLSLESKEVIEVARIVDPPDGPREEATDMQKQVLEELEKELARIDAVGESIGRQLRKSGELGWQYILDEGERKIVQEIRAGLRSVVIGGRMGGKSLFTIICKLAHILDKLWPGKGVKDG